MSPVSTVVREPSGVRNVPVLPFTSLEQLLGPTREIVVDWQMPSDTEHKG
jgi:hypothetical protein